MEFDIWNLIFDDMHESNGIFVIDKPPDMTSARVVACVKKVLNVRKAGHTGTLDPFATGVMICCINQSTRLARFFLHGNKKYEAVLHLGIETDTQDSTGTVLSKFEIQNLKLDEKTIYSVFKRFEGGIEQLPPVYSALKHEGVPLYKLARKGTPVQKPARRVFISFMKILDINLPRIRFEVSCSAGTYIRTLAADIGTALGCGALLESLRRTESNGFAIEEAITLPEMESLALSGKISDRMTGMADALREMPNHVADDMLMEKIKYGRPVTKKDIISPEPVGPEGFFKVVDANNNLLAVLGDKKRSDMYNYCCVFHK